MSSIQEKNGNVKKAFLLRSASLEKIRCSAYPLIGSIFSKDSSFIHLLVNTMNSSRALVEPMFVMVIPAVRFLCVAMAFCLHLIRKLTGGVSCEQLDKFIAEVNYSHSKRQSYSVQKEIKTRSRVESETKLSTENDESQKTCDESFNRETFYDCNENIKDCRLKITNSFDVNLLRITSFACVFFVYLQFSLLVIIIGYTQLKAGFIFLLMCVFSISSLVLKISFINNSSKEKRVSRRQQKTSSEEKKSMNSTRSLLAKFRSRSNNCLRKAKLL